MSKVRMGEPSDRIRDNLPKLELVLAIITFYAGTMLLLIKTPFELQKDIALIILGMSPVFAIETFVKAKDGIESYKQFSHLDFRHLYRNLTYYRAAYLLGSTVTGLVFSIDRKFIDDGMRYSKILGVEERFAAYLRSFPFFDTNNNNRVNYVTNSILPFGSDIEDSRDHRTNKAFKAGYYLMLVVVSIQYRIPNNLPQYSQELLKSMEIAEFPKSLIKYISNVLHALQNGKIIDSVVVNFFFLVEANFYNLSRVENIHYKTLETLVNDIDINLDVNVKSFTDTVNAWHASHGTSYMILK